MVWCVGSRYSKCSFYLSMFTFALLDLVEEARACKRGHGQGPVRHRLRARSRAGTFLACCRRVGGRARRGRRTHVPAGSAAWSRSPDRAPSAPQRRAERPASDPRRPTRGHRQPRPGRCHRARASRDAAEQRRAPGDGVDAVPADRAAELRGGSDVADPGGARTGRRRDQRSLTPVRERPPPRAQGCARLGAAAPG